MKSKPPKVNLDYEIFDFSTGFGRQYSYFNEKIDPQFPVPLMIELDITIFVGSGYGHDKVTGNLITGILYSVGSTSVLLSSKRQCISLRYYLLQYMLII